MTDQRKASHSQAMLATAMHLLSIPSPWLAPLVGILLSQRGSYLKYHSWRAFYEQVFAFLFVVLVWIVSISISIWQFKHAAETHFQQIDWVGILFKSAATFALLWLFGIWNTINGLLDAARAAGGTDWGRGKWLDRMAQKRVIL